MNAGPSSAARVVFFGALALGIAVRAVDFLNCRSLGLDEARLAVNVASRSFLGLLRPLDLDQTAPPLFLWGERVIFQLLGHDDCGLRLLPVAAGTAAGLLMYPLASRFLDQAEARLAGMIAMFSPLLITYSNAVKQYSVELLASVLLLLFLERALRREPTRGVMSGVLAVGAVAPWVSLSSIFVLSTAWTVLAADAIRRRAGAARLAIWSAMVWGVSAAIAYVVVYREASRNPYLQWFWELAFVTPGRPGFAGHAWKTLEDLTWGFVAGDPLIDRRPFLGLLHVGTVLVAVACALGCRRILRTRSATACWWLLGPALLTLGASMLGLFPVSPRLTLFLLPGLIVLFVAGVAGVIRPPAFAVASALLVLPLAALALKRTFSLEPSRHFQRLVGELRERRLQGERVYVFARSLPPWIYYTTDWSRPDTVRLRFLIEAAGSGGLAFENARSRGRVREAEAQGLDAAPAVREELLGLPSGMEWREVQEHIGTAPDSGWVEIERRRIEDAAAPGVWILATAWYPAESELFAALERDASRRTFARLRGGSALVRYEFGRTASSGGSTDPSTRQSRPSASLGRRRTTPIAGR